jgi:murein lipoprotein
MTQTIEINLVDVLNRLENKIDNFSNQVQTEVHRLENKIDNLSNQVQTEVHRLENKIEDISNQVQTEVNRLENKIDKLSEDVNDIKTSVAKLDENQNGLNKRLENVEFINRSIFASILVGIVLTIVAGITKLLFPTLIA